MSYRARIADNLRKLFGDEPRQAEIGMFAEIVESEVAAAVALRVEEVVDRILKERLPLSPVEKVRRTRSEAGRLAALKRWSARDVKGGVKSV